jgi:ankyrin repeat protein
LEKFRSWIDPNLDEVSVESQRDPFEDTVPHEIPSTCDWILEKTEFETWKNTEGPALLLIQGGSGQGKSVMGKAILKRLRKDDSEEYSTTLGYFCKSGMIDGNEAECIVKSFLSRLLKRYPECFKYVQKNINSSQNPNSFQLKDLWQLLIDIISNQNLGPINLIIDGLDECEDESQIEILTWLKQVFVPTTQGRPDLATRVHALITSQPTAAVREKGFDFNSIKIEAEDLEGDIIKFIEYKVRDLALDDLGSVEAQRLILERLKDGADGTFLWADRILEDLDQLGDDITLGKIQDVLNSNPRGLSEYYERILQRISQEGKEEPASTLFDIILSAPESFHLHDLAVASHLAESSIDYTTYSDIGRDLPSKFDKKLRRLCKSFVKVSNPLAGRYNARIEIMHHSARVFLLDLPQNSTFHHNRLAAHDMMAKICLQYLLLDNFKKIRSTMEEPSDFLTGFPFLHYACKYWPYHVRESDSELKHCIPFLKQFLCKDSPHFAFWFRSQSLKSPESPELPEILYTIVKHRLQNVLFASQIGTQIPNNPLFDLDINEVDHEGKTALHLAVQEESEGLVKLLLNAKADVNVQLKDGFTAINLATEKGLVSITKLLLDAGADISISGPKDWLPIHYIARQNLLDIVTASDQWNTYVNAITLEGFTPIHIAARNDHHHLVTWLLNRKVEVNCVTGSGATPLHWVASEGHIRCMDQLIKAGAHLNERTNAGWTAVHFATSNGHIKCLGQLIKAGANLKERDNGDLTALYWAASNGYTKCLDLLIKAGAHPYERNNNGWTTLHLAASEGHTKCLDLLIKAGINLNERNNNGWTALHLAASKGHTKCLDLLIKAGINLNERTEKGHIALHLAAIEGHTKCLDRLIEAGANPNERDFNGFTALHQAVRFGKVVIANRLLDLGAIDSADYLGSTALHWAMYEMHAAMFASNFDMLNLIQAMIKTGSDLHSPDLFGYSALEHASRNLELFGDIDLLLQQQFMRSSEIECQKRRQLSIVNGIRHFQNNRVASLSDYQFIMFARLLLLVGDEHSAHFLILRFAELQGEYIEYNQVCDLCKNECVQGAVFVCRKCPGIDLCQSCMGKYHNGTGMPGCHDHEFFRVPRADTDNLIAEFKKIQDTPLNEWFQQLLTKYDDHHELLDSTYDDKGVVDSDLGQYPVEIYEPSRLRWYWSQVFNAVDYFWEAVIRPGVPDGFTRFQWTCVSFYLFPFSSLEI